MSNNAQYCGNLARVAIAFYLGTGRDMEQWAAYWYTRYAVRAAIKLQEENA